MPGLIGQIRWITLVFYGFICVILASKVVKMPRLLFIRRVATKIARLNLILIPCNEVRSNLFVTMAAKAKSLIYQA